MGKEAMIMMMYVFTILNWQGKKFFVLRGNFGVEWRLSVWNIKALKKSSCCAFCVGVSEEIRRMKETCKFPSSQSEKALGNKQTTTLSY